MKNTTKLRLLLLRQTIWWIFYHITRGFKSAFVKLIDNIKLSYYIDRDYTLTQFGSRKEGNLTFKWVKN